MMEKEIKKAMIMMEDHKKEKPADFFSLLPDEVLWLILSFLPIDEVVRSSILSKRWRSMWKYTTHLDFDIKHVIYPSRRLITTPNAHLDFILNLNNEKGIYRYNILSFIVLRQHSGDLTSCRFSHFPLNDVKACLPLLLEQNKALKDLTLECEPIGTMSEKNVQISLFGCNYLSSLESLELVRYSLTHPTSFEANFQSLRTLKLQEIQMGDETIKSIMKNCESLENFTLVQSSGFTKLNIKHSSLKFLELNLLCVDRIKVFAMNLQVLVLASLSCRAKEILFATPNLREFHCSSNQQIPTSHHVLKTSKLLEYCSGLSEHERGKNFRNLLSMSIDLDLNNVREAFSLSYVLRRSRHLRTLRIVIPVDKHAEHKIHGIAPHLGAAFWKRREACHCVRRKLKFVRIEGFTGKDLEVEFIKHLIEGATKLKRITIICNSSVDEANELLSVKSAYVDLSIKLMAAKIS